MPDVATTVVLLQVKVKSIVASSAGVPFMSVKLSIRIVPVYKTFVADTAADLSCNAVNATVVPYAACSVARTEPAAVSFKKVTEIVSLDSPETNLFAVSPIAVTEIWSRIRFNVNAVTWSLKSTELIFNPTLLFRNIANFYSSSFVAVALGADG